MPKHLHPKILEAKRRSPFIMRSVAIPIVARAASTPAPEDFLQLLDERVVRGYSSLWESKNDYGERFMPGAWKRSIDLRGPKSNSNQPIKFFRQHNQGDVLSTLDDLSEDDEGLYFRTKPLDPVDSADRVLIQLRSGSLNNYSNGFNPVWDKAEYDDETDTIWYKEANLHEISVVGLAADPMTYTMRSKAELDEAEIELSDEIEYFIKTVPKGMQLEARNLFARQKSLFEANSQNALGDSKDSMKAKAKLDINYLIQNLNK